MVAAKFGDEGSHFFGAVEPATVAQDRHVIAGWRRQVAQRVSESFGVLYDLGHGFIVRHRVRCRPVSGGGGGCGIRAAATLEPPGP